MSGSQPKPPQTIGPVRLTRRKLLKAFRLGVFTRDAAVVLSICVVAAAGLAAAEDGKRVFNPVTDLLSLHYDHAPDKDDGHSAAADRTLIESVFGGEWIPMHVLPVSGAYGKNKRMFNAKSDTVMDAVWNERGGWVAADRDWDAAVKAVHTRWHTTVKAGGDVYVKEGGQSDITAAVVILLHQEHPEIAARQRIHVVQHSNWNEDQTTPEALEYVKGSTHYVRIADANRYLNVKGGDTAFEKAATAHPVFGAAWQAAFEYYPPASRLDFSDTGELLHILGLGEISIEDFRKRFVDLIEKKTSNTLGEGDSK
jgi:hypothetical protein